MESGIAAVSAYLDSKTPTGIFFRFGVEQDQKNSAEQIEAVGLVDDRRNLPAELRPDLQFQIVIFNGDGLEHSVVKVTLLRGWGRGNDE